MVLRFCFIFALLVLCCSNPYEQDNPTDSIFVYSVSFNAGEATGGTLPAALSGSWGDTIQLPDLERSGYVLDRWTADSSGVKVNYAAGGEYIISGSIAMTAVWLPAFTVTFDGNEATGGTPPPPVTTGSGYAIVLPDGGSLERTGYIFDGWNVVSPYTVTGDVTLYAKWLPVYTVTFDGNGATGGTVPAVMKIDSGSSISLPDGGNLAKSDYSVGGWNTDSSGTGTNYGVGSSYTVANDITLYAIWVYYDVRDRQEYKITTIGTQVWMAENLNYYTSESKCYYNNFDNCAKYGRLYNWYEALNACPSNWHLPNQEEWEVMIAYIGGESTGGGKLKAKSGWGSNGNGTDEYGFSALPGGNGYSDDSFGSVGNSGNWWTASENDIYFAWYRTMNYDNEGVETNGYLKRGGLRSVRCLQGSSSSSVTQSSSSVAQGSSSSSSAGEVSGSSSSSSVEQSSSSSVALSSSSSVDLCADFDPEDEIEHYGKMKKQICDERDGNRYVYVTIDEQTWLAENLNYDVPNNTTDVCYGNNSSYCTIYGRLYNWNTAMNNVCPEGWHLPSQEEWGLMTTYIGGESTAGTKLKATTYWSSTGYIPGTDYYGFSALPGGNSCIWDEFCSVSFSGSWWSSTETGDLASGFIMSHHLENASSYNGYNKNNLYSVRCLQNN